LPAREVSKARRIGPAKASCTDARAGSVEQAIRAYDVTTGQEVWKARLPAGGQATPMTAGGKPTLKTQHGTKIVAYALPR
jgi:quinoprotein glucose dehydrogenase